MSRSPHDRALDVAARRYISHCVNGGRPPMPGDPHDPAWPEWAGPFLEEIQQRAHKLTRAADPDAPAFLAALHRLAADHHDATR
jgi:hypothetical protein